MWQKLTLGLKLAAELLPILLNLIETITLNHKEQKQLIEQSPEIVKKIVVGQTQEMLLGLQRKHREIQYD